MCLKLRKHQGEAEEGSCKAFRPFENNSRVCGPNAAKFLIPPNLRGLSALFNFTPSPSILIPSSYLQSPVT